MKKFILLFIISFTQIFPAFGQDGKWKELNPKIIGDYEGNIFPDRNEFGMAQLTDKKVLIFGGDIFTNNFSGVANDTWIYDYEENSWTQITTKNTPPPREAHSVAQITDGKVLLYGGYYYFFYEGYDTSYVLRDTWIFDFSDTNWHEIEPLHIPRKRTGHGMAKLSDGKVILFGGSPDQTTFTNSSYIFDLETLDWRYMHNDEVVPKSRCCFGISQIEEGKILIYGGWNNYYLNDTWIFDENSYQWIQLNNTNNNSNLDDNPIVNLTKDYLFMFGGTGGHLDSSWVFDKNQLIWVQQNDTIKPQGRYLHNMANITNGKALMLGGVTKAIRKNDSWLFELDSNYISVKNRNKYEPEIKVFSNDMHKIIIDFYSSENYVADIEIYNINGIRVYRSDNIQAKSGWNRKVMQVENLSSGIYFVVLKANNTISAHKVLFF